MLILSKTLLTKIHKHAEAEYPHECCGAIIGELTENEKKVMHIEPIQNNWEDTGDETKTRRFMISSEDYKAMEQKAKALKMDLLGFYHSHPDHPPNPSETDLKFAWPFFSYPILSVMNGKADQLTSQSLDLSTDSFASEPIIIN
ncbi:MAG: M67 family metallopeptidase [Candidatus Margulisiibacteriota bacterium]